MTKAAEKKIRITLRRSLASRPWQQRATASALGLKKISQSRIYPDNPQVRGMARHIIHLVEVEEVK
jgi:large subunit ribosomal protein L30